MEITSRPASSFPTDSVNSASTLNRAAAGMNGAVDRMAVAADGAAAQIKPAIDRVATLAHQAVSKAASVAGPAADWINQQGESLDAARQKAIQSAGETVRANPWKTVGIAVLAGFVLSRYLR
jgi:ElaB/YqjD/DUF883 family membrane-anchored ribosome-binding protein